MLVSAQLTGGNVISVQNNLGNAVLLNAQTSGFSQTVVSLGTLTGTVPVNYTGGSYQQVTLGGDISLAFSGFTVAGTQDYLTLEVTVPDITYSMTLPAAVGSGGSNQSIQTIAGYDAATNSISWANTGTYLYSFSTADQGSTIYINDLTLARQGVELVTPYYANVTGTGQTVSLSTATSTNFLVANNTGYTTTVNMPTAPVNGQIARFTVSGNTMTLITGTGAVAPTFAGSVTAGSGFKYIYRESTTTWNRSI